MKKRIRKKKKGSKRKRLKWDADEVVSFYLTGFRVKLSVIRGTTSYFQYPDEKGFAEIFIDVGEGEWWRVVDTVWHELLECCMGVREKRFAPSGSLCRSSESVLFVLNHDDFTVVVHEAASAWDLIEKPLKKAWREHRKLLEEKKK